MFDTKKLLDGFLGGGSSGGKWGDSRQGGIGSLGGGGGGGSLKDVLGGLLGGGIGSLGGGGGGSRSGGIGSLGDESGSRGGGFFGGPIGSLGGDRDAGGAVAAPGREGDRGSDRQGGGFFGPIGGLGGGSGGGLGGAIGTAAAGGLLGSVLGGGRRGGGGLLRAGGLAVLGTLAYRAYQQWQQSQGGGGQAQTQGSQIQGSHNQGSVPASGPWSGNAPQSAPAMPAPAEFAQGEAPAADGAPFGLSLVKAMISAAKADGHLDDAERGRIFEEVERLGLDAEAKGFVFQSLDAPVDPSVVAAMARTDAQKSEIYMVSRLVAEPDTAAERAYLDALAHRLGLAPGLRQSLDAQAMEAGRLAASGELDAPQG